MSQPKAQVSKGRRLSSIWILPLIVFLVGSWVVFHSIKNQGPVITIEFSSGEGLVAGKTKVKARSVDVGLVEEVRLSADFQKVLVKARLDKEATPLLTEDAVLWIVKPRVGASGISGVGTLLSGPYIELDPGTGATGRKTFAGLNGIPNTPKGTPGKWVTLRSDNAKSLSVGDAATFRGFQVGHVESSEFNPVDEYFEYEVFIQAPYHDLLTTSSRFWNASGILIQADVDGISINTASLESLLSGGVAFDLPESVSPGESVENGHSFKLYPDFKSVESQPFEHHIDYLLLFDTSVRGLRKGAPVEYRGIKIGSVTDISFKYLPEGSTINIDKIPVPVRIRIDPARLEWGDSIEACENLAGEFSRRVDIGMRASLQTGNLLTGSLFVSLEFYEGSEVEGIGNLGEFMTFPTTSTGLAQIEQKVVDVLDTILNLPLEETFVSVGGAIEKTSSTLESVDTLAVKLKELIARDDMQQLPSAIQKTLAELQLALNGFSQGSDLNKNIEDALKQFESTLRGLEELADTIKAKPNSLIFPSKRKSDPKPKAAP